MRFWRDACETKELRDKRAFVEKGLEFAVTEMARETLKSAISENQRAAEERTWAEGFTSEVTFLRLTNVRPLRSPLLLFSLYFSHSCPDSY